MLMTKLQVLFFLTCLANSWAHSQFDELWTEDKSLDEKLAADFHQESDHAYQASPSQANRLLKKRTVDDDLDKLQDEVYQLQAELEDVMAGVHNQNVQVQGLNELYDNKTVHYCWAGTYSVCSFTGCCYSAKSEYCEVISFTITYYYTYHKVPAVFIYLPYYDRAIPGSSYKAYYNDVTETRFRQFFEPSMEDTDFYELFIAMMSCA